MAFLFCLRLQEYFEEVSLPQRSNSPIEHLDLQISWNGPSYKKVIDSLNCDISSLLEFFSVCLK